MISKLDQVAGRIGPRGVALAATALTILLGFVQYALGPMLNCAVFFVLPVALTAWYCGLTRALVMCGFTAAVLLWADLSAGEVYAHAAIPIWNATVRLIFYLIITQLLMALRESHSREAAMADTDPLTGLANTRRFYEELEQEIARSQRFGRHFTLAYLDADNFKTVNDQLGHAEGDRVLREIALGLKTGTRATDVVARLGGDEFAVLFPECGEFLARQLLPRLRESLISSMRQHGWPVGFSVGAVIVPNGQAAPDQAIHAADELMFAVKRTGKNEIRYRALTEQEMEATAAQRNQESGRGQGPRARRASPSD